MCHIVYLGLGSNLGDRQAYIQKAIRLFAERVGVLSAVSNFYESPSWGYISANNYLNVAVKVETTLKPEALLAVTQEIERAVGRQQKTTQGEYCDREIDIDILLYDNLTISTANLTIPHPLMHQRPFVLHPLAEITPSTANFFQP